MDRNALLGMILITLVLLVWMWYNAPKVPQQPQKKIDTLKTQIKNSNIAEAQPREDTLGIYFSHLVKGEEKKILVETDFYTCVISSKGALVEKFELKRFKTWSGHPVQLVEMEKGGDLSVVFMTTDGKIINTRGLYFDTKAKNWENLILKEKGEKKEIEFVLNINDTSKILKRFIFENGKYSFDTEVELINMEKIIANFEYQLVWENGIKLTEENSVEESYFANAWAKVGDVYENIDASKFGERVSRSYSGVTRWVGTHNKYFAVALISNDIADGAYLEGWRVPLPNNGVKENYLIALKVPFRGEKYQKNYFTVYIGPLDYTILKSYGIGLEEMISLGLKWLIRPIAEFVLLPLFRFLHLFIPNYGVVIIIFSILIKILLTPLTMTQMKSVKKMQAIAPILKELQEKYKDNPQKLNQEVMKVYREYGVNPFSGCWPLLLQLPILYALFSLFRVTIELRQAGFILWIKDLSVPDTIIKLPFYIPIFGVHQISGLALLMAITMFIQQWMFSTTADQRQKVTATIMTVLFFLIFNNLPSGLNLYYFTFNVLSIAHQWYINKYTKVDLKPSQDKKRLFKGGVFKKFDIPTMSELTGKKKRKGR
jgi:YidC/Oxa1 family membrane protein insertase